MVPIASRPADCCPHCGAVRKPGRSKCWLCGAALPPPGVTVDDVESAVTPYRPSHLERRNQPFQYTLSSLFLLTTLVAIICSVFAIHPGLGVVAAVFAFPALLWTAESATRSGDYGKPMSAGRKTLTFILAFFASAATFISVIGTFVVAVLTTCNANVAGVTLPSVFGDPIIALAVGGVASITILVVLILLFRKIWLRGVPDDPDRSTDSTRERQ
jgi:hypothetical protein